jgi:hypothetical protein
MSPVPGKHHITLSGSTITNRQLHGRNMGQASHACISYPMHHLRVR